MDLLRLGPVLVAGPASTGWPAAAAEVAHTSGVQVDCHHLGHDLADVTGRFLDAYGIAEDGAVLLRPDGFIAWRAREAPADGARVLEGVLRQILCLA